MISTKSSLKYTCFHLKWPYSKNPHGNEILKLEIVSIIEKLTKTKNYKKSGFIFMKNFEKIAKKWQCKLGVSFPAVKKLSKTGSHFWEISEKIDKNCQWGCLFRLRKIIDKICQKRGDAAGFFRIATIKRSPKQRF